MMRSDYQPVSCQRYSDLELAALRGLTLRVAWRDGRGLLRVECLRPINLRTRWHAEFMIARTLAGHLRVLRLDRIREAGPL